MDAVRVRRMRRLARLLEEHAHVFLGPRRQLSDRVTRGSTHAGHSRRGQACACVDLVEVDKIPVTPSRPRYAVVHVTPNSTEHGSASTKKAVGKRRSTKKKSTLRQGRCRCPEKRSGLVRFSYFANDCRTLSAEIALVSAR